MVAADSILVSGDTKTNGHGFSKLVQENGMTIGPVGDASEAALMWSYVKTHKPEGSSEMDVLRFFVEFAKWKNDYCDNKRVSNYYLFVYEGKIFFLEGLSVQPITDFYAIGAGRDYALAALHLGHTPKEAVKVACELCCYVAEPIVEYEIAI
jgi:ATP-dependent protease HslVU (ClpYQ) peptidase subunit